MRFNRGSESGSRGQIARRARWDRASRSCGHRAKCRGPVRRSFTSYGRWRRAHRRDRHVDHGIVGRWGQIRYRQLVAGASLRRRRCRRNAGQISWWRDSVARRFRAIRLSLLMSCVMFPGAFSPYADSYFRSGTLHCPLEACFHTAVPAIDAVGGDKGRGRHERMRKAGAAV